MPTRQAAGALEPGNTKETAERSAARCARFQRTPLRPATGEDAARFARRPAATQEQRRGSTPAFPFSRSSRVREATSLDRSPFRSRIVERPANATCIPFNPRLCRLRPRAPGCAGKAPNPGPASPRLLDGLIARIGVDLLHVLGQGECQHGATGGDRLLEPFLVDLVDLAGLHEIDPRSIDHPL